MVVFMPLIIPLPVCRSTFVVRMPERVREAADAATGERRRQPQFEPELTAVAG
jgi:hypothetical protein